MKGSERHKIKEDKFAATVYAVLGQARKHQNMVILGVTVVVIAAIGITWAVVSRRKAEKSANRLLAEAVYTGRGALTMEEAGKAATVNAVIALCNQISAEYGGTDAAVRAMLHVGQLLSRAGKQDEAIGYFKKAIEAAGDLPGVALLAQRGLAEALEAAGKVEAAIAAYEKFKEIGREAELVHADWDIGRCYQTLGNEQEARRHYQLAVEHGAGNRWALLAEYCLAKMTPKPEAAEPALDKEAPETPPDQPPTSDLTPNQG